MECSRGGRAPMVRRLRSSLAILLAGLFMPPVAAYAAWPETPPNDPQFAPCENAATFTSACYSDAGADQWDMFGPLSDTQYPCPFPIVHHPDGGLPCWAAAAFDPDHMSGVDFTGAWAQGNVGRDDILIAYMEGGVNYSSDSIKDALDNEWLNKGELPCPERADGTSLAWPTCYDLDRNGRFDIRDYVHDPRVNPSCPAGVASDTPVAQGGGLAIDVEGTSRNCVSSGQHQYLNAVHVQGTRTPYLSPEDLIAVFGHCRMQNGRIGQCPPGGRFDNDGNGYPNDINGWNADRDNNDPQTEDMAYNHAPGLHSLLVGVPDNGYAGVGLCPRCRVVPVKTGAEALGRSDKWAEGLLYAADIGVTAVSSVVVNYTYSRFIQDAIDYAYGHGVVMSLDSNDFDSMDHTDGMLWDHALPGNSAAMDLTGSTTSWFRSRSNITSYGTHNVFSGGEYTTSGATPFQAGILAMVQSAALNLRDSGLVPGFDRLTPNEIKQVLMDTAQPIIPNALPPQPLGPGAPPGTKQPQWPGNPNSATDATHTNWSTQYGYGRPDVGAATAMVMAGKIPPTADITAPQWYAYIDPTVTRKLEVDGSFARSRFNSGGSVSYVLEWALGADPADGDFHAVASATAGTGISGKLGIIDLSQVPPSFYTHAPLTTLQPDGAEQYTMTIRLRVNDANGLKAEDRRSVGLRHDPDLLPGFPVGQDPANWQPFTAVPTPRAATGHSRNPDRGNWSPPVLADLEGTGQLDIVMTAFDGFVYAFRPDGTAVPGWPVEIELPASYFTDHGGTVDPGSYIRDPKLMYPVTVADVLGLGHPQVFVPSFESNGQGSSTEDLATALLGFNPSNDAAATWLYGLYADGNDHAGGPYIHPPDGTWPVTVQSASFTYDQSIDFVGESTSPPVIADFGSGPRIITGPITGGVYSINPDGSIDRRFDFSCPSAECSSLPPYRTGDTHTLVLTGTGGLGDLYGTGTPAFIMNHTGVEPITPARDVPAGANLPQGHEKPRPPRDGQVLPGWPKRVDGFPFYSSPITADVAGLGMGRSAIEGNDTYFIHAFQATGLAAPGFPKYTGQWQAFAGVVADPLMNGQLAYATPTREGFVFTGKVAGDTALNDSWWHYRHDEHNTGTYGVDTRRPASIRDLRVVRGPQPQLAWTAPGDDYMAGAADRYDVRWPNQPITSSTLSSATPLALATGPQPAGSQQSMAVGGVSGSAVYFAIRTLDMEGNVSALSNVAW